MIPTRRRSTGYAEAAAPGRAARDDPRSASGISAPMIKALKITADSKADSGVARCMM